MEMMRTGEGEDEIFPERITYEKKIESYHQELGKTQAKLTITRMETMETKLNCDLFVTEVLQQIKRMDIIQNQLKGCDDDNDECQIHLKYPENIFLDLYEILETSTTIGKKEKERILNEVKKIHTQHDEKLLEDLELISTLKIELTTLSNLQQPQHSFGREDHRYERISQEKDKLALEVQKLEKDLLDYKIKCEQLKIEMNSIKSGEEKYKQEIIKLRNQLATSSSNLTTFDSTLIELQKTQEELQRVQDELSSTKRELEILESQSLSSPSKEQISPPHSPLHFSQSKENLFDYSPPSKIIFHINEGQEEQKPIRCRHLHRASSLSDLENSYQSLRSEYLQCQLDLTSRDKTIFALSVQLKSKESELLTAQSDHSSLSAYLRNEITELKSKLVSQDLSLLTMCSESLKRDEISQKTFLINIDEMIENKINDKTIPNTEELQNTFLHMSDQYSHVINNYQMEIQSLKEQLQLKEKEIERLMIEVNEKHVQLNENQYQMHAAMDGLRRQMEGFKTQFLQTKSLPCSPSDISHEYDVESLSKELVRAKMDLAELNNDLSLCQGSNYQLQKQVKMLEERLTFYNMLKIF